MLTIISGTHRSGSNTRLVSAVYERLAAKCFEQVQVLDLELLPKDFVFSNEVFGNPTQELNQINKQFLKGVEKLVFILPEYNGGIPGVLKAMIDSFPQETWYFKKVALVGVSSGRAGNLRGMDDLTNYMNYMKSSVLPNKVPLSSIHGLWLEGKKQLDENSMDLLKTQIQELADF